MGAGARATVAWLIIIAMVVLGLVALLAEAWAGLAVAVAVGVNGIVVLRKLRTYEDERRSR